MAQPVWPVASGSRSLAVTAFPMFSALEPLVLILSTVVVTSLAALLTYTIFQNKRTRELSALSEGLKKSERDLRASEARLKLMTAQMPWPSGRWIRLRILGLRVVTLGDMSQNRALVVGQTLIDFPCARPGIPAHRRPSQGARRRETSPMNWPGWGARTNRTSNPAPTPTTSWAPLQFARHHGSTGQAALRKRGRSCGNPRR